MSPLSRSSSLLDDLARDALDPAYTAAAARRAASPGAGTAGARTAGARTPVAGTRRGRAWAVWLLLAVFGVGLAFAVHRQSVRAPEVARARGALIVDIRSRTAADRSLATQINGLQTDTARQRAAALSQSRTGADLNTRIAGLDAVVGGTAVHGAGVTLRLSDAPATRNPTAGAGNAPDDILAPVAGRILDRDVADAANALWAAGARAVAVGGVRLTATTAIRTAGDTILVGFTPLQSPYDLVAVGDPDRLVAGIADSAAGRRLAGYHTTSGIGFSIARGLALTVPAATLTMPRLARESDR
ncbi:MAG: DUF881 domain-containing protein [Frankia sp.]